MGAQGAGWEAGEGYSMGAGVGRRMLVPIPDLGRREWLCEPRISLSPPDPLLGSLPRHLSSHRQVDSLFSCLL